MLKEGILNKIQEQYQAASSSFNFSEKVMELAKIVKETVVSYEWSLLFDFLVKNEPCAKWLETFLQLNLNKERDHLLQNDHIL